MTVAPRPVTVDRHPIIARLDVRASLVSVQPAAFLYWSGIQPLEVCLDGRDTRSLLIPFRICRCHHARAYINGIDRWNLRFWKQGPHLHRGAV